MFHIVSCEIVKSFFLALNGGCQQKEVMHDVIVIVAIATADVSRVLDYECLT